jgi:diacylglycerol kinase
MKLMRSFAFAFNGLKICFSSETNFKIHFLLGIVAVSLGIGFHISAVEWIAVLFCITLVMTLEMMNTAVERLCNVVHKEFHPAIKHIKDIAAGAVFISALFSLMTGLIIFVPKIVLYLKSL